MTRHIQLQVMDEYIYTYLSCPQTNIRKAAVLNKYMGHLCLIQQPG